MAENEILTGIEQSALGPGVSVGREEVLGMLPGRQVAAAYPSRDRSDEKLVRARHGLRHFAYTELAAPQDDGLHRALGLQ